MQKTYHIFVEGRVQGVGFRYFTKKIADSLSLSGWVRNTFDGKVEIKAQGESSAIEKFLIEIKRGPIRAKVENVMIKIHEEEPMKGFFIAD